jgi:hypothetical protein
MSVIENENHRRSNVRNIHRALSSVLYTESIESCIVHSRHSVGRSFEHEEAEAEDPLYTVE